MYCEHDHLIDQCEMCSFARAVERGDVQVRHQPQRATLSVNPSRVTVSEDTLIDRTDLGEGIQTLVVAGEAVPIDLEDLPRHPREKAPAAKPAARRRRT